MSATPLQIKIGGEARTQDQQKLIMAAQLNVKLLTPQIGAELQRLRMRLRTQCLEGSPDLDIVFTSAHQIRGLAGSINRDAIGALADLLATYITDCVDANAVCADDVILALAGALYRSFDFEDGDTLLAEALEMGVRLVKACPPR